MVGIRDGAFNLAVMTCEKLMGFLVHLPALIARCTALVIDEVQSPASLHSTKPIFDDGGPSGQAGTH